MPAEARPHRSVTRPLVLPAVALCGTLAAGMLGGLTNAVNGAVSPTYFVNVLRWYNVEHLWRASIAQGVFEGLLFGLALSLVFTVGMGLITAVACSFRFAMQHLLCVFAGAAICWGVGGATAVGLAALSPEFYRQTFPEVPQGLGPMLCYAWVGGSIWGVELGGFASMIIGLVALRANWRSLIAAEVDPPR
jgi:hypothetical protein